MTIDRWESGTVVKLLSGDRRMTVVGLDSVGSIICEWPDGDCLLRGYFTPAVLMPAEDAGTICAAGR
jgi:uncharacterized protein YodC (DUF2158 family)